ncbi:MAG TPA: Maf family protein [Anaerolineae bacterium]|nr:Maf family protein [Anaerolineae bacterium]
MSTLTSPMRPLILASASPRRRALLATLGRPFEVHVADVDERPLPAENPSAYGLRLALAKARAVADRLAGAPVTVLGADTLVVVDGRILGKPADAAEASAMLNLLRGRRHDVLTAVAVVDGAGNRCVAELAVTGVWMRAYSGAELRAYVESGDPMDKAGAYAIQHEGFRPVDRLEGSETNVIGLPLVLVRRLIQQLDRGA